MYQYIKLSDITWSYQVISCKRLRAEVVLGAAHECSRDEVVAWQCVGGEPEVDQL